VTHLRPYTSLNILLRSLARRIRREPRCRAEERLECISNLRSSSYHPSQGTRTRLKTKHAYEPELFQNAPQRLFAHYIFVEFFRGREFLALSAKKLRLVCHSIRAHYVVYFEVVDCIFALLFPEVVKEVRRFRKLPEEMTSRNAIQRNKRNNQRLPLHPRLLRQLLFLFLHLIVVLVIKHRLSLKHIIRCRVELSVS
jgi:hypothetical protein